jgi:hypothetical protein
MQKYLWHESDPLVQATGDLLGTHDEVPEIKPGWALWSLAVQREGPLN